MSQPIHRRYRLLQGTQHCPVAYCLRIAIGIATLLLASLLIYEWHEAREEALEAAQYETRRAVMERDEIVYLVTFGAPTTEAEDIKLNWRGEPL